MKFISLNSKGILLSKHLNSVGDSEKEVAGRKKRIKSNWATSVYEHNEID